MVSPTEIIRDIQERLDRVVRDYRDILALNKQLETENQTLANSLKEAVKQQEIFKQKLDTIRQETLKESKNIDLWKNETRREIRSLMKEVEKCIPQVEALLEKKS